MINFIAICKRILREYKMDDEIVKIKLLFPKYSIFCQESI